MNIHKYDTPLNEHLVTANPLCAFRYGWDKLFLIEIPDFENVGYVQGWVLLVNHTPYYYSVARGSDELNSIVAEIYAHHLGENGNKDGDVDWYDEDNRRGGEGYWKLTDDTANEFDTSFCEAMHAVGFSRRDDGGWERRTRKQDKKHKKGKKHGTKVL